MSAIRSLLEEAHLPHEDLEEAKLRLVGAFRGSNLVGVIGLEMLENQGLLRSMVVKNSHRGEGIGRGLLAAFFSLVETTSLDSVYLLTTDASSYFERFGFTVQDRENSPAAIRASTQFTSLCPTSATLMVKDLL